MLPISSNPAVRTTNSVLPPQIKQPDKNLPAERMALFKSQLASMQKKFDDFNERWRKKYNDTTIPEEISSVHARLSKLEFDIHKQCDNNARIMSTCVLIPLIELSQTEKLDNTFNLGKIGKSARPVFDNINLIDDQLMIAAESFISDAATKITKNLEFLNDTSEPDPELSQFLWTDFSALDDALLESESAQNGVTALVLARNQSKTILKLAHDLSNTKNSFSPADEYLLNDYFPWLNIHGILKYKEPIKSTILNKYYTIAKCHRFLKILKLYKCSFSDFQLVILANIQERIEDHTLKLQAITSKQNFSLAEINTLCSRNRLASFVQHASSRLPTDPRLARAKPLGDEMLENFRDEWKKIVLETDKDPELYARLRTEMDQVPALVSLACEYGIHIDLQKLLEATSETMNLIGTYANTYEYSTLSIIHSNFNEVISKIRLSIKKRIEGFHLLGKASSPASMKMDADEKF